MGHPACRNFHAGIFVCKFPDFDTCFAQWDTRPVLSAPPAHRLEQPLLLVAHSEYLRVSFPRVWQ
ncbi:MAG: hypothetical protein LBS09_08150, partial [Bacteroidales bacterium]|nr:hypothetical protein [Bacteroidales bacterium]